MIKIFLKWLRDVCKIPDSNIDFRLAFHENAKSRIKEVQRYWSDITGFSINNFQKIDWKKHKVKTKRKNIGEKYFGVLHICVKKSTNLNRRIEGWIEGIYKNAGWCNG